LFELGCRQELQENLGDADEGLEQRMFVGVREKGFLRGEAIKGVLEEHMEVVEHLEGVGLHQGHFSQHCLSLQLE
jgi:hypothetical protein